MTFHDVRLREDIERGAEGGPVFNTTVVPLASGHEQRNINWEYAKHEYDISYGIMGPEDYEEVRRFFYARRGRAYAFRFKDWSDFEMDSVIATGDGSQTKFQLYKTYTSGGQSYVRPIFKPVSGTVTMYVNDVLTAATVDHSTGVVTFSVAPANGAEIRAVAEFDVPVRFDQDKFGLNLVWVGAGSVPSIMIKELRQEFASLT